MQFMYTVRIRTLGEITMDLPMGRAAGYRFDIPCDSLGIPYLPLRKLLVNGQEMACDLLTDDVIADGDKITVIM